MKKYLWLLILLAPLVVWAAQERFGVVSTKKVESNNGDLVIDSTNNKLILDGDTGVEVNNGSLSIKSAGGSAPVLSLGDGGVGYIRAEGTTYDTDGFRIRTPDGAGNHVDRLTFTTGADFGDANNAVMTFKEMNEYIFKDGNTTFEGKIVQKFGANFTGTGNVDVANANAITLINFSSPVDVQGLSGGTLGQVVHFRGASASTNTITVRHNSGSATQTILTPTGADITFPTGGLIGFTLIYTGSHWHFVGATNY